MDDPYRPPAHLEYTQPTETEDRVTAPRLMCVFSMIFAITTLATTSIFLYIYTAVGDDEEDTFEITPTDGDEDVFDEQVRLLTEALELELGLARASAIGLLVMSGALIVLAVGQRRYRRWARWASVVWGALGLLLLATAIIFNYAVVQPAWEAILDGALTGGAEQSSPGWSGVLKYVLFVPFPIAMILVFVGPRVGRVMNN